MTPEREKEIREWFDSWEEGTVTPEYAKELLAEIDRLRILAGVSVTEKELMLTEEIDRLRIELTADPYVSKARHLEVVNECDQLKKKLAVAVEALEKIQYLGAVASKKGDKEDQWLRHIGAQAGTISKEALSKIRGEE
jgi:hypothetical protein